MNVTAITVSIGLLAANAFFVAAEFAIIAARATKLEGHAGSRRRVETALGLTRQLQLQLAGAQLGITMASLGLGYVAEPAVAHGIEELLHNVFGDAIADGLSHTIAFVIGLTIVVFLHMVVGEMVPKNIAIANPERTLLSLVVPYRFYITVFRPFIAALNGMASVGARLFGVEPRDEVERAHTAADIAVMVEASREEGLIEEFEHDLITSALDLDARHVSGVMVPTDRVVSVRRSDPVATIEQVLVSSGHSRLPIARGEGLDDVVGFVHAKDLLQLGAEDRTKPVPVPLIRRMLVVEHDRPLDEALLEMQRARIHLGVVRGPDGATVGVVTLEDIIEELVGDIADETDRGGRAAPRARTDSGADG
ncbi:MAG: hemolysin family protein [Actinomycetota bacterium]|nr:hemolysin family protein [Actinomycetota bacterium]